MCMPLILALGKQEQVEFEASMVYRSSFITAVPQRNTVSRDKNASGLGLVICKNKQTKKKTNKQSQWWLLTPFIPALGRSRQVNLCEFKPSLGKHVVHPLTKKGQNIYRQKIIK